MSAAVEIDSRFRAMADYSPVLLWMSGTDSECFFFNQTWLDFTGRKLDQELGVGWAEGVHPEDFARCMDIYQHAFATRERFEAEYRLRRRDGQYRWILDRGSPRYSDHGDFEGFIGSCIDITEHHVSHEKLRLAEAQLRQSIEARDEFLSIVSHELKTPLTSLALQMQLLSLSAAKEEGVAKGIDLSKRQIMRLTALVEDLIEVSTSEGGRVRLDCQNFDLVELVREVIERVGSQAASAGCEIRLVAPDQLTGRWDRFRIDQVLVNLLTNAVKYGAGKPIEIDVSRGSEGGLDQAEVQVTDHGIGIQEVDLERVFKRYERAVSSKNYGGLGLGLYIARQIAELHGGVIEVDSRPGEGATFRLKLPLAAALV